MESRTQADIIQDINFGLACCFFLLFSFGGEGRDDKIFWQEMLLLIKEKINEWLDDETYIVQDSIKLVNTSLIYCHN